MKIFVDSELLQYQSRLLTLGKFEYKSLRWESGDVEKAKGRKKQLVFLWLMFFLDCGVRTPPSSRVTGDVHELGRAYIAGMRFLLSAQESVCTFWVYVHSTEASLSFRSCDLCECNTEANVYGAEDVKISPFACGM